MCHLGSQVAQRSLKQLLIFSLRTINVLRISAAFMCSISLGTFCYQSAAVNYPFGVTFGVAEAKIQDAVQRPGLKEALSQLPPAGRFFFQVVRHLFISLHAAKAV
jgi:hypothetical protein